MAIRNVYKIGKDDEILRKHSKVVKEFDERLWQLLDDMSYLYEDCNATYDKLQPLTVLAAYKLIFKK